MSGAGELSGSPVGDDGGKVPDLMAALKASLEAHRPVLPPVVPDSEPQPLDLPGASYFATIRSMTEDPDVLAAVAKVEAELGEQRKPIPRCSCGPKPPDSWCPLHGSDGARWPNASVVASGVVPDKPALAYDESCDDASCDCCETWRVLLADIRREANAPVPAVTDDEAATERIALVVGSTWIAKSPREIADAVVAALRASGYSLVRSTREDT